VLWPLTRRFRNPGTAADAHRHEV